MADPDLHAHLDAITRTRPGRQKVPQRPARRPKASSGLKTAAAIVMAFPWMFIMVGAVGWWLLPGVQSAFHYPSAEVYRQIDGRLGKDIGNGYILRDIEVFPPAGADYDYQVTLGGGGVVATAAAVGPYAYDHLDAAIKIRRPEDIRKSGFMHLNGTTASAVAAWVPSIAAKPLSTIASGVDIQRETTASGAVQAFANGLALFRVPDADRAKLETVSVNRVIRSESGFTIEYEEGTALAGYLFAALAATGLAGLIGRRFA